MMSLISTSFQRPETSQAAYESIAASTVKTPPTVKKIRDTKNKAEKLLDPVSPPPLVTFKAKKLQKTLPVFSQKLLAPRIKEKLATQPNFTVNISLPSLSLPTSGTGNGHAAASNSGNGLKKYGGSGNGVGGENSCTIAFVLDTDGKSISELQWIGCMGAAISDQAEKALYEWVTAAPKSYTSLNPRPGDTIEFTFERR